MAVEFARRVSCTGFRRWDQLINAGRFFQQIGMLLEIGLNVIDGITGTGDFVTRGVHVNHETCRCDTDQYQHHQTNAFLPIVRAMREGHADSGNDQRDTRPEWRFFLTVFLLTLCWRQVDARTFLGVAPVATQDENQSTRNHQTHNWRDDQRTENAQYFRQVQRINDGCPGHQGVR